MKTMNKSKMMGEEKIPKLVLKFALPTIAAMLVNAVYNAVDAMFVSWLGVEQSGAISVAFPIFMLILGIGLTFGTGAASYISRLLGKDNIKEANCVASTAVFTTIIVTAIFTFLLILFEESVLKIAGATDTILPYAKEYSTIIILGCIFPILSRTLNNIIRAEGNVKFNSLAILLGAVFNIMLDPIFIFSLDMGIKGAAYATVISQAITTILLGMYFILHKSNVKIKIQYFKAKKSVYKEIVKIGLPTFLFQLLMSISLGLINSKAGIYGDSAVAAMGIANRIFAIGMFVIFGFSKGFQPIAGYNYGALSYVRLKEAIGFSVKATTIFACIITAIILIFSKPIMALFTDDITVQTIGSQALIGLHIMFPLFGAQMIFTSLFLAMGRGKQGGILSIARQGIFFLPLIIILPKIYGLNGVIYTQAIADMLTSAVAILMGMKVYNQIKEEIKRGV